MRYRLPTAIFLSSLFFISAALRPLDVAHDTDLYVEMFNNYFTEGVDRFSELVFGWIAGFLVAIFDIDAVSRPIIGKPYDFWIIFGIVATLVTFMIILFKRKGWL